MNFNIYNILIIAGIIQGFIFTGIVLFSKKYHCRSTFFLLALIFCYSISNLMYILPDIGAMSLISMYSYIFLPFASLIAPIIYFYVISFMNPEKELVFKEKLLFVPFIICTALVLFYRVRVILEYDQVGALHPNYLFTVLFNELFAVLFSITLLIVMLVKIGKYEKQIKSFDKTVVLSDVAWLKITISIILTFTLLWGYLAIENIFFKQGETVFYSLWISMTALIYWLGHIGIYKYGIISERQKIRAHLLNNEETIESTTKNSHIIALENLLQKEKLFLDSKITLDGVAEHLNLSPGHLSRIIHSELNNSFSDYINLYRVNEAKSYLKNPEFANYTILAIGLEAGFNSKSSFYDVFKKSTGKTPLSYQIDIRAGKSKK